jgi:hypothetical protein
MIEHWYTALREPVGLCLRSNDRALLRQKLYAARREAKDEALEALSVIFSIEDETHLWIIKAKPDAIPTRE